MSTRNTVTAIGALCLFTICTGCTRYIEVTIDESVGKQDYIEVDLVGIGSSERKTWGEYSMTEYFKTGDKLCDGADKITFTFDANDRKSKTLSTKNKIWDAWEAKDKKNLEIFVLAFLPGTHKDKVYEADTRRLILPMKSKRWGGWFDYPDKVNIVVKQGEILAVPAPKPAE